MRYLIVKTCFLLCILQSKSLKGKVSVVGVGVGVSGLPSGNELGVSQMLLPSFEKREREKEKF